MIRPRTKKGQAWKSSDILGKTGTIRDIHRQGATERDHQGLKGTNRDKRGKTETKRDKMGQFSRENQDKPSKDRTGTSRNNQKTNRDEKGQCR